MVEENAYSQEGFKVVERNPTLRRVGLLMFAIFIILGVILVLLRSIPDLEATMYGFIKYEYPNLKSLQCPVMMTTADREAVTIRLSNPLNQSLAWLVQSQISSPVLILTSSERVELQPHETRVISWPIDKSNIAPGNFILAYVYSSTAGPEAMREATCGTYVLDLPVKGGPVIFYAAMGFTLIGVGVGLWLLARHTEMSDPGVVSGLWWMRVITIFVAIGLAAGLFNAWFLALLMILLIVLATAVFLVPNKV